MGHRQPQPQSHAAKRELVEARTRRAAEREKRDAEKVARLASRRRGPLNHKSDGIDPARTEFLKNNITHHARVWIAPKQNAA